MLIFLVYLVLNIALAVAAFWIATSRPQYSRLLWWITGAFVLAALGLVIDVVTNPQLSGMLLRF